MEEKQEKLVQFLKALRISLNYISLYSRSHRAFLDSLIQLKEKLAMLLSSRDQLEISFTPESLVIDGQAYGKTPLERELARAFHSRKVRSVCFRRDITEQELALVLEKLSLPVKDILGSGGLKALLAPERLTGFRLEELDYSQLLKGDGEEVSDIWAHLCGAVDSGEAGPGIEFLDTFETMAGRIRGRDLIENDDLRENVRRLLEYIREKDGNRYVRCSTELLKALLRDKSVIPARERMDKLKPVFSGMDTKVLSSILWEGISGGDNFDNLSLEVFARLIGQEKHEQIADELVKRAGRDRTSRVDPRRLKRMREIFSLQAEGPSYIPDIYRRAIAMISEETYFDRGFSFDRHRLQENYDNLLLGLLSLEREGARRETVVRKILDSWDKLVTRAEPGYLIELGEMVPRLKGDGPAAEELERRIGEFLEKGVWSESFPPQLRQMASALERSVLGPQEHLRLIFGGNACSPDGLRMFFRLFPSEAEGFFAALAGRYGDFEFMSSMIDGLKRMGGAGAVTALKRVFSTANDLVRVEALRALAELQLDDEFLLGLLRDGSFFLKKEALGVLMKDPPRLKSALGALLDFPNPWGSKNDVMLENLSVIEEAGCRQARQFLLPLTRLNFLVYGKVIARARELLRKWDA